ncbi:unnamed protein product [Malus baccata var. baccata]
MGMASQTTPSSTSMKKEPLLAKELADVEKVLRVPKEDRHLVEKVGKKVETSTKKRRVPMLVPSEDILFRKHRKAEAEAIGCAPAIVAGEDRRLLPPLPTINPIFPPVRECIGQKGDLSSSSEGKDKEEVGSVPRKDLKVAMRPKDFGKTSKALGEAIQVKDQHFESLKRRNGENLRLTVQLKATKKQLETTMLEVSKVKGELDSALVEVSELKSSIPTEKEAAVKEFLEIDKHHRKGETFDLAVYSCSADESGDEASADEQSHQGDDEFGDAENDGRTQSDMIRGSTSDEDD